MRNTIIRNYSSTLFCVSRSIVRWFNDKKSLVFKIFIFTNFPPNKSKTANESSRIAEIHETNRRVHDDCVVGTRRVLCTAYDVYAVVLSLRETRRQNDKVVWKRFCFYFDWRIAITMGKFLESSRFFIFLSNMQRFIVFAKGPYTRCFLISIVY